MLLICIQQKLVGAKDTNRAQQLIAAPVSGGLSLLGSDAEVLRPNINFERFDVIETLLKERDLDWH